ncbi:RHS repeat-associated core domain-containing protein [Nonomuraea sp. NPDC026600]|uniref:RHS repeat-associated core domain-containing protein n=1 Tax=Nonomuraea sp. NPDC026600 TaxID=3155363 RepID=UPI0033F0D650
MAARLAVFLTLMPGLAQVAVLPAIADSRDAATTVQGTSDTPRQQMGVTKDLPSLVPASVTTAPVTMKATKSKIKPPKGAVGPDIAARTQSTKSVSRAKLPSGVARAEARDASAEGPEIDDMWPLNGALSGSATPTLVAHADAGESPYRYEFTVCESPSEDDQSSSNYDLWCFRQNPDGTLYVPVMSGQLAAGVNTWKVPAGSLKWARTYAWRVEATDATGETVASAYRTFVTGTRQPSVGSQLAARDKSGQEFQAVSGNYTTTVVDASVATVGSALSVVRSYNSLDARRDGLFGAGWSTRFDMRAEAEPSATLLVTYPDGRRLRFSPKGDGSFLPPPGMHATLAAVSGGGWKLMDKSSTVYHFNGQGRLTRIVDARGLAQELTYGSDGKLSKATSVGGRSLNFTWNGAHVATVSTDPINGAPLTWSYSYEGDKLTTTCNPGLAPNCTTYAYNTGSLYRGVVEDDEPVGYWRLGAPTPQPTPTPTAPCPLPPLCGPQGTNEVPSLGWGLGPAPYTRITLDQPGALGGSTDTSATLDGESEIELPANALARLSGALSLELWFKTTSSGILAFTAPEEPSYVTSPLLYKGGTPVLYVGTDGKLRGQFRTLGTGGAEVISPITSPTAVNNGQWHHAVLSGADTSQTLYLDGVAAGSLTGKIDHNWMAYTAIGTGPTTGWPASKPSESTEHLTKWGYVGQVDEMALYDRALSGGDVTEHYGARLAAPHLLSKVTLPSGRVWANNTYNAANDRLLTNTDEHGGTWTLAEPTSINTETGSTTVTVTDPANQKVSYEHDAWRGYRTKTYTDQKLQKTTYEYDSGGYPFLIKDPNGVFTRLAYDDRGNLLSSLQCQPQDPNLPLACYGFPSPGDPPVVNEMWSSYYVNKDNEFDPRNDRLTKVRDGRTSSDADNSYATTLEYNQYGELTKQTTPGTLDFPNGRSVTATYTDGSEPAIGGGTTPAGLAASQTDARGNTWTYRYTAAGDLAEQTDPAGLLIKLSYDALGRVGEKSQVSQAYPDGVKTTFTYDTLGRPATQTEPGVKNEVSQVTHTKRTTFAYDPDGNKLSDTIADLTGGDAQRATVYTYDSHGQLETTTDPEGGVLRQGWNSLGLLAMVIDARGAVVDYAYTERGQLASRTLKGWTDSPVNPKPATDVPLESFSYDPGGRLAAQLDVMLRKTSFTYFADGRLWKKTANEVKLNNATSTTDVVLEDHTYDKAGNQTKLVTGGGKSTTEFVYDAANRVTSQTFDPADLARKTAFVYDANDNMLKSTRTGAGSSRAEVSEFAYNKVNQVIKTTTENGDQDLISTTTYDDRGLATAATDPRGNVSGANAADFTTTMRYDKLGQLIEASGPQVKVDKAGTSSDAHPTAHYGYDMLGAKTHETDAEGRTVTSVFDKAGRLTSQSAPSYTPPGGTAVTPTTRHTYDAAGQLITTTDPRGYVTTFDYDKLGRQVRITDPAPDGQTPGQSIIEYDMAGEKLATVDPTGARAGSTYDGLGRQVTQTQIERKPTAAVYTTKLTYNEAGFLTKTEAPGTKTVTTDYTPNAAGEVESQTVASGTGTATTTSMEYDLVGRLIKTADQRGNSTTAEYDLAGRKIATKDLEDTTIRRTTSAGYDPVGNQTSLTSGEGHISKQTFDALNRVTSLIEPISAIDSITTSFGYDATGARTRLTDGRGNATWTSYNSLGLTETVTEPATTAHPAVADRTSTAGYDAAGNPNVVIQPGGVRIDRTFDHLGRLTKETGAGGGAASAERTFGYDLADRPTAIGDLTVDYNDRTLPLSVKRGATQLTGYTYDGLGNPRQRVDAAGTATFTWDANNRPETATDPVTGRKLTYGYDQANNLASLTATTGTTTVDTQIFTYDYLNRPESQTLRKGTSTGTQLAKITYGWDKDDNLTTKTTAGLAGAGTNTYGYDHAGRLTSWTAPGGTTTAYEWDKSGNRTKAGTKSYTYDERNRLTSGDGTDYTYTPRGTLATQTKAGTTTSYTFDAFDRLIADGDSLYSYDALDRVASRIRGTAKQTFAYAGLGNGLAAITDSGGAVQAKYGRSASGTLLGQQEGTNPALATLTDLHGDLVATYSTTALATTTAYDSFGTITAQTGTKTTLGYQGEYTDPDTGKVNMHARWYQPGTGTFTSRDTATLGPSPSVQANRYTYANASPLTGTDPTGHATVINGDSLAGSGYNSSGSSGGGQCIGSCGSIGNYSGGAIACDIWSCGSATVDPSWAQQIELENEKKFWLGQDELERLGWEVMPNGRPVDQPNFWFASEKVQNDYMAIWSPTMTDKELAFSWASVGGLQSFATMERTAKENPNDSRLGEWRKMQQVAAQIRQGKYSYAAFGKAPNASAASRFRYFSEYERIIKHYKAINQAAAKHGVDRNVLTALILFESDDFEVQLGVWGAAGANIKEQIMRMNLKGGWAGSYGVTQMEAYKARWMLVKYYGKKWKDASLAEVVGQLLNPSRAIHLAAAYLAYLKKTITYKTPGGYDRRLDDFQAALAYCGCSGVTVSNPVTASIEDLQYGKFQIWMQTGALPRDDRSVAYERLNKMKFYINSGVAQEYWNCIEVRLQKGACP